MTTSDTREKKFDFVGYRRVHKNLHLGEGRQVKKLQFVALLCAVLVGCQASPGAPSSGPDIQGDSSYNIGVEAVQAAEMEMIEKHLNDADTSNDAFLKLARDAGGFQKLNYRMRGASEKELRELVKPYGIRLSIDVPKGTTTDGELNAQNILDCKEFLPSSDRNKLHVNIGGTGTNVYIDSQGRPAYAYKWFAPLSRPGTTPRSSCQTTVGYFGVSGDVGGHLIAASLYGSARRANMVPQSGTFNNGPWRYLEIRAGRCARSRWTTGYQANAWYSSNTTSRPYSMRQFLSVYNGGRPVHQADISYFYNQAATPEMTADAAAASAGMRYYCP